MKRTGLILASLAAVTTMAYAGCSQDKLDIDEKLVRIDRRLKNIEKKTAKLGTGAPARPGAARAGKRPQRPAGPDPQAVYSVPIDGSPFKGAKHAKVTVVEAFEFA